MLSFASSVSLLHRRLPCWWLCRVNNAGQVTRNTVLADVPAQEIVEAVGAELGSAHARAFCAVLQSCKTCIYSTAGLFAYLAGIPCMEAHNPLSRIGRQEELAFVP